MLSHSEDQDQMTKDFCDDISKISENMDPDEKSVFFKYLLGVAGHTKTTNTDQLLGRTI